jgi:hypothetical protein
MKKSTWIIVGVILIIFVAWLIAAPAKPSKLDAFATCLGTQGVKFYGAFWCPHCQAQKALFGPSAEKLPYIECSTPDGSSQNQTCNALGITSYPTWIFPNGARMVGVQTLDYLSATTSCALPQ